MPHSSRFPPGFLWGAATSAYQIEGSPLADGAGPSNWHRFSHEPGRTANGDTGDMACDHYRRYPEDVELMKALGLGAYRFSLAWSRILPQGQGRVNPKGMDFYARLIDLLLAHGIQPLVTLHHWDLPAALDDVGGWLNPEIVRWFAEYAEVAFRAFGDRVPMWATINEPWVMVDGGYLHGVHAPGHQSTPEAARAARHMLCAHGAAVLAFRGCCRQRIGLVVNLEPQDPASEAPEDRAAAARMDAYMNRQFLDPALRGETPELLPELFGDAWVPFTPEEMKLAHQPLDFLGINYYKRGVARNDPAGLLVRSSAVSPAGSTYTSLGWEVHPESFTRVLCWVKERYGEIPLYVTENGAAFDDPPPGESGLVEDPQRVRYYRDHLCAAREALRRGVNLRGYFAWSLLDNFEWSAGYSKRFGLYRVDYATQRRSPKASAHYYRKVIRSHGSVLEDPLPAPAG